MLKQPDSGTSTTVALEVAVAVAVLACNFPTLVAEAPNRFDHQGENFDEKITRYDRCRPWMHGWMDAWINPHCLDRIKFCQ